MNTKTGPPTKEHNGNPMEDLVTYNCKDIVYEECYVFFISTFVLLNMHWRITVNSVLKVIIKTPPPKKKEAQGPDIFHMNISPNHDFNTLILHNISF
jgi:hypothetical protein